MTRGLSKMMHIHQKDHLYEQKCSISTSRGARRPGWPSPPATYSGSRRRWVVEDNRRFQRKHCVTRAPLLLLRSRVALSLKVCLSVCLSVSDKDHLTKPSLSSLYKGIKAIYWHSAIKNWLLHRPIRSQYHQIPSSATLYWHKFITF